ncbi:hypothetical protein J1N35_023085 [Gossypium stocksii]|uniref:Uncharacterized protein n=1 Tax=Gossypium stocksii TaxID=47602 RepID=A0A9D3VJ06_9ROSI|nr:hypothetical protein J1N35_023085 [Gossypium stocksii]
MDSEGKQSLPTSGGGNSKPSTEALAELLRKVVEEVLDAKVKEIREMLQEGCLECKKRKDPSSQRIESRSEVALFTVCTREEPCGNGAPRSSVLCKTFAVQEVDKAADQGGV